MDLDNSGAVDLGELKLLIKQLTGETLTDGRAKGLMYEVDMDRSGQMDFDEFVLAMIHVKKGKGSDTFFRLANELKNVDENEDMEALRANASQVKLNERRKGKKKFPHGHYCVCGCRAITKETQQYLKKSKKMRSIFPKLSARQLRAQSQGGGASAALALDHRDAVDEQKYTAANLVPEQARMTDKAETPKWSLLQTQFKRESVY